MIPENPCPHCAEDLRAGVSGGLWVCLACRDQFTEDELAILSDTLRIRFAVLSREIERAWWPIRLILRRDLRARMARVAGLRDAALRRWWNDPR